MGGPVYNSVGQTIIDDVISHHGVKGMKWGVRKDSVYSLSFPGYGSNKIFTVGGDETTRKELANITLNSTRFCGKVGVGYAKSLNRINTKYKALDPNSKIQNDDKLYSKYREETRKVLESHVNKNLPSGLQARVLAGKNLNSSRVMVIGTKTGVEQGVKLSLESGEANLHHSDDGVTHQIFNLNEEVDSFGFYTGKFSMSIQNVKHEDDTIDIFLEHHGIKGMKWGVRRTSAQLARAAGRGAAKTATKIKENRAAKKESSSSRSKSKHLSDQELQALVNRLRLEQDLKRLVAETKPSPKADGLIKSIIKENSKRQLQRIARSAADIAIEKALAKAGAPKGKHVLDTSNKEFSRDLAKALEKARTKK